MSTSKQATVEILAAFVDDNQGGNLAGVVLNADDLTHAHKLYIASKVGLSETAFVSTSNTADFKLDFFTPTRQIAHCGHATIATFSYLSQLGLIKQSNSSKETIDGRREITLTDNLAFMEQKAPKYINGSHRHQQILKSLHLESNQLLNGAPISIINTGNSFAIIPVANNHILQNLEPDFELITALSDEFDLIGYYAFTTQTQVAGRDANTRMFAPRYGIKEEAGTGMAAGPLACYLYNTLGIRKETFLIEQGWHMQPPSPSLITVELSIQNMEITKLMVGGKGVQVRTMKIEI